MEYLLNYIRLKESYNSNIIYEEYLFYYNYLINDFFLQK